MDARRLRLLKILAATGAGLLMLGYLGLRYAGVILAPFLSDRPAAQDSQALAAGRAESASVRQASSDTSSLVTQLGPFVIDGRSYRFEIQRDTGASKPREAARRVQVFDSNGRVVYDENLFLRRDSTGSEDWLEFTPTLLEDASGIARGFRFTYSWFPSAPNSGVAFNVVAPRGDSLVVLTPTIIGYYGNAAQLPQGSTPGSERLQQGNHLVIESGRGWYDAFINLRVDFTCAPRSLGCVKIDLPDSVAGLPHFQVRPSPIDSAVVADTAARTIDLWAAPHSARVERLTIPPGQQAEILGGASKVYFDRTPSLYLGQDDEWLEIRVNGKRGWITGAEAFRAIGLQQVG
jgi:hypothetical protein